MLLRDTHCFYDNIKYSDDTDSASDQSPSIKNLKAESKNIVKETEKTKSKKRKANQVNLGVKRKVLRTNNRFKKPEDNYINYKKIVIIPDERGQEIFNNLSKKMYLK